MQADKVKRPILLIHGEDDNNTGTFPMQVRDMSWDKRWLSMLIRLMGRKWVWWQFMLYFFA